MDKPSSDLYSLCPLIIYSLKVAELPFAFLIKQIFWQLIPWLSFFHAWVSLFLSLLLLAVFTGHIHYCVVRLFFPPWQDLKNNVPSLCSCSHNFLCEITWFCIISPLLFSFICFQELFLYLWFSKIMIVIYLRIWYYLSLLSLYFSKHFATLNLDLSPSLRKTWHSFSNMFCAPIRFLPSGNLMIFVLNLLISSHSSPRLSVHSLYFCPLCSSNKKRSVICLSVSGFFTWTSKFCSWANTVIFTFQIL